MGDRLHSAAAPTSSTAGSTTTSRLCLESTLYMTSMRFRGRLAQRRMTEIRMLHVLEHLREPMRAIAELHRIARPGGIVTVRVPYWNSQDFPE